MLNLLLVAVFMATAALSGMLWRGMQSLESLAASPWPTTPPRVTIIVAARNEGATIEPAMRSLLAQRGLADDFEVIAVNDRSEDDTGEVLSRLAAEDDRLTVVTVEALPEGWLGKNHALWQGAQRAQGNWLLFTDADVVMTPEAVARAVARAERDALQHVTAMPAITATSPWLRIMIIQFAISFLAFFRPWRLNHDPTCFAGIGAFNLVAAPAYERVGGHSAIALTPVDDILLGRLLRRGGAASRLVFGDDLLRVAWYPDARSMIRAFHKNGFAAFDYRLSRLITATALYALLGLVPWLALLVPDPATQLVAGGTVAIAVLLQAWFARESGWPWHTALLSPAGTAMILWMWWRAVVLTLRHGGIDWRGTHYSLAALREHHDRIRWS
jgi:glycosyltransferase involved in cell wall biosynthesis